MFEEEDVEKEVVSWCIYCKEPIYKCQPKVVTDEGIYHTDCFQQSITYIDSWGDNESE